MTASKLPADRVKLQFDASTILNAVANHSGHLGRPGVGVTGWRATGVSGLYGITAPQPGVYQGRFIRWFGNTGSSFTVESPAFGILPGQWVAARYNASDGLTSTGSTTVRAGPVFFDANGALIGTAAYPAATTVTGATDVYVTDIAGSLRQAPAGTASARIRFEATCPAGSADLYLSKLMVTVADVSSDASGKSFDAYNDPIWTDIGELVSARINRGGAVEHVEDRIEVGTLHATIRGSIIDPATDNRIRPGRLVRVITDVSRASQAADWRPLFTGRLNGADASYADLNAPGGKPSVTLSAVDVVSDLSGVKQPYGYPGNAGSKARDIMLVSDAARDLPIPDLPVPARLTQ